ncbi:uncharacterized protein LOC124297759 [Neodiprion virginianus]|uniref:uncharacterized protein LOC124297759 n=1 Tax=Neodiprion virginianus TaxID=2961670 RepID=UPI001EE6AEC5|nr:uncharacterized protein LOC124297759 [Neodiprion virginianus]
MLSWIAHFGIPLRITSDLGGQFESNLFKKLSELLGFKHKRTTAYHPQANGLVERLHRQLKAALLCHEDTWYDALPAVLLGLRAAYKEDIEATPAELVLGEPLRLPGEFLAPSRQDTTAPELVRMLRKNFQDLAPEPASRHTHQRIFVHQDLANASHVFIRNDQVRPSFSAPYDGPYPVVDKHEKYFTVKLRGRNTPVSIDRLKPAYLLLDELQSQHDTAGPSALSVHQPVANNDAPTTATSKKKKQVRLAL